MLVAAMNPCPCGYYPDREHCTCTQSEILRYMHRVPGPILDRFDLCVDAPKVPLDLLVESPSWEEERSSDILRRVLRARDRQRERFGDDNALQFNADLSAAQIEEFCPLGSDEKRMIQQAFRQLNLSARAYHRILKVARTIADLDDSDQILSDHLAEAIGYRSVDRGHPGAEGMVPMRRDFHDAI